jgi:hypothetical protein
VLGILLPVIAASAIGALWVGSTAGLRRVRVQWWPLALASIAIQLVLFNPPVDRQPWALTWGPWIWGACLAALLAVCVRNGMIKERSGAAFWLAGLGVAVNLFVVLANGGYMPQSPEARLAVRGSPLIAEGAPPQLRNVTPSGPETRFVWLSDVIPQPTWLPTANVVSVGDIVLSMALAWWAFQMLASARTTQVWRRPADSH